MARLGLSLLVVITFALLAYGMRRFAARLSAGLEFGRFATTALALNLGVAFFLSSVVVVGRITSSATAGFIAAFLAAVGLAVWMRKTSAPPPR